VRTSSRPAVAALIWQTQTVHGHTGVFGFLLWLFVVAFGMSWGPVVWVLLGEMFPNRIRAAALGLAAAAQWIANCLITASFPKLGEFSLSFAYGFYAVCAVLSLLFVWRFVDETKGKHLEDMHSEAHVAPTPH